MEKYSQNDEQRYILEYFKNPKEVFFLDIGAFDGRVLSNTHALALLGASGVCVEPSPSVFPYLQKLYRDNTRIKLYDFAIAEEDGEMDFFDSNGDALSTLCKEDIAAWEKYGHKFTKTTVKVKTIKNLLALSGITKVDFLTIDAEGYDFQILKQIDLTSLGVKMICIECPHEKRNPVKQYLGERGYKVIYHNSENILTIKE
jgi:FkbM family methyltransferase